MAFIQVRPGGPIHAAQPTGTPAGFILTCTDQVVHAQRVWELYPLSEGYRTCGQAACSIAAADALEAGRPPT